MNVWYCLDYVVLYNYAMKSYVSNIIWCFCCLYV